MGFVQQKHASGIIGVLVVGMTGRFIVRAALAGGFANVIIPGAAFEDEIAEQIETYPGNDILLDRLESDFPRAYDDFAAAMGDTARASGPENRMLIAANAWIGHMSAT